jgi:hypothetical protein
MSWPLHFLYLLRIRYQALTVSWWMKCAMLSLVLLGDFYCIAVAMADIRHFTGNTQMRWLTSVGLNISVDIFIVQLGATLILHVAIPSIVRSSPSVAYMRASLDGIAKFVLVRRQDVPSPKFSATNYFFASSTLARLHADQLESTIALSYRSPLIPRLDLETFTWDSNQRGESL